MSSGGDTFASPAQPYQGTFTQDPTQQTQYNNLIAGMRTAQKQGNWNPQTFASLLGNQGIPPQMANILWNNLAPGGFAPFQQASGANDTNWLTQLQGAAQSYNQNVQQGAYLPRGMQMRPPDNGGYGYDGGYPGNFQPNNSPPPWMAQQLQAAGWSPPSNAPNLMTQQLQQSAPGGATGQMSQGAPPWAQALQGGYALPQFIGQPSIPFASAQQWNNYLPQEQQAILGTAQSVGIDPQAYLQQMQGAFPEWGPISTAQYSGY
jgi:hypothetical protein